MFNSHVFGNEPFRWQQEVFQRSPRIHKERTRSDWRSGFFTVFMENVSCRISKSALREAFSAYGEVMDVYISFFNKYGKARPVTFAFVRFKHRREMEKTIKEGNNRRMDSRFIKVKEAAYSKEKVRWSRKETDPINNKHIVQEAKKIPVNAGKVKDGKSYKDALLGNDKQPQKGRVWVECE
ncbi:hypothetical protein REPUB_Repub14bG0089700 [Reevesia pubescens]